MRFFMGLIHGETDKARSMVRQKAKMLHETTLYKSFAALDFFVL